MRMDVLEKSGLSLAAISGVSDGDCSSRPEAKVSRDAFLEKCSVSPWRLARARQVHGTIIHIVDEVYLERFAGREPQVWPDGDGLITNIAGIALGVNVADCVPLWIYDPVRRVLGLFHAGREGTLAGIATAGVAAMVAGFGSNAGDLLSVIGPSAGPCCYELSTAMAQDLDTRGFPIMGQKFDMWEANRRQLISSGVKSESIFVTAACTLCGNEFHSFRKSGTASRNLAVGML